MRIEIRVRMIAGGTVTRHYVVPGYVVALCGRPTLRPPTDLERWAHTCTQCVGQLRRLELKS
jgi:hypothetical protein